MSESLQFVDIVFYALVAAFFVFRLRSVLGRRSEKKARFFNFLLNFLRKRRIRKEAGIAAASVSKFSSDNLIEKTLSQIRAVDPRFSVESFLQGAQLAFFIIVDAFTRGDRKTLRPLLADAVFESFNRAIDMYVIKGKWNKTKFLGTPDVEIISATIQDSKVFITLRFVSEQIISSQMEISTNLIDKITDLWTFTRDLYAVNPNWTLTETFSEN